jgi:A/G-specific adenine glycosylase
MTNPLAEKEFRHQLLTWFDQHARDLPWRRTKDPWAIWVSEIMLQQTRVAAVMEHYLRFMERFPTVAALAEADEAEVLACWSGLGYYRRARMLHQAAKQIVAGDGLVPGSAAELRRLPGIGEYTAAAIASIAFGEAAAVVDGNVERVLTRYLGSTGAEETRTSPGTRAQKTKIQNAATALIDHERPADFNQAMMELGAMICLPRGPLCLQCPIQVGCATRGEHVTAPAKKMLSRQIAYALLRRKAWPKTEVLLQKRPADASLMPGMWELPQTEHRTEPSPGSPTISKPASKPDPNNAPALTVRHSITNTNYYVSVFELSPKEKTRLAESEILREWIPTRRLLEIPLTGLTRKILKRLKILPGFGGSGPLSAFDDPAPDIVL